MGIPRAAHPGKICLSVPVETRPLLRCLLYGAKKALQTALEGL